MLSKHGTVIGVELEIFITAVKLKDNGTAVSRNRDSRQSKGFGNVVQFG